MTVSVEMIEIMLPALIAGMMIALTHAPLGIEVLKRGIIFIDLAIAQIAGLGLVLAGILWHEPASYVLQFSALGFALLAAFLFRLTERHMPKQQEAIIGVSYVIAATLALLLLADSPRGGEEIQHLLSGQILFITWQDVLGHAPVYALILLVWFAKPHVRKGIGFYLLFALAITSSVQLVGVFMVFASLILPALAAVKAKYPHFTAWLCGIISVVTGMVVATLSDLPAGLVIVMCYAVIALMCAAYTSVFSQEK